jgi:hypothetical protein
METMTMQEVLDRLAIKEDERVQTFDVALPHHAFVLPCKKLTGVNPIGDFVWAYKSGAFGTPRPITDTGLGVLHGMIGTSGWQYDLEWKVAVTNDGGCVPRETFRTTCQPKKETQASVIEHVCAYEARQAGASESDWESFLDPYQRQVLEELAEDGYGAFAGKEVA